MEQFYFSRLAGEQEDLKDLFFKVLTSVTGSVQNSREPLQRASATQRRAAALLHGKDAKSSSWEELDGSPLTDDVRGDFAAPSGRSGI